MNRELVQDSVKIIIEQKRRQTENRIAYYKPSDKQRRFHTSKAGERWAFTGNRFGKTCMATVEAVWHSTGLYPEWYPVSCRLSIPSRGRIVCVDFKNGITKIIIPALKEWMPRSFLINGSWDESYEKMKAILTLNNGSTIELMSFDQELGAFGGTSRNWVWFDEHGRKNIYDECKMRLVDTRGRFWGTLTPAEGISWEFEDIYEKRDIRRDLEIFRGSTFDNPILSPIDVKEMTKDFDEDEKRRRLYGDFVALTGLIYSEWDRDIHLIEPFRLDNYEEKATRYCAIDPHTRTPTAVLYWAVMPNGYHFIYDELYLPNMTVKEMANLMLAKEDGDEILVRYIDPSAKAENVAADFNFIEEFSKNDIYTSIAENKVDAGIQAFREYLKPVYSAVAKKKIPKLYVFNTCKYFIKEIEHYRWPNYNPEAQTNIKEKPLKKDVHLPDCARYIAISKPEYLSKGDLKRMSQGYGYR